MTKTLSDYFVLFISIAGSIASIYGFGLYFIPTINEQGVAGIIFLGFYSLFFFFYSVYLIIKHRRKIRYADIFEDINIGFAKLREEDKNETTDSESIIKSLTGFCDNVSSAFSKVNGHEIGVCIKFISDVQTRPIVHTLVRDGKSLANNRKTGTHDKTIHYLDQNSDFNFIYTNFEVDTVDTSCYYEANLPVRKDYRNTRLNSRWPPKKLFLLENFFRRIQWPLKYRSTIVVPIVPLIADNQNQKAIRGFLCIDSHKENAFNKNIDLNILKGISDGLYNMIDKLDQLNTNKNR